MTNRSFRTSALAWLLTLCASWAHAQQPPRLVDVIEVNERDTQVDITLQFNCTLRYVGHSPASQGPELRLRLRPGPDCGAAASSGTMLETPPFSGGSEVMAGTRLESVVLSEVALTLTWKNPETFVLAQGADVRGMRVRLLRQSGRRGRVMVMAQSDVVANYAVNLESRREPFDEEAVELARTRLGAPVFVSEIELAGERWYRLRAGPIDRRSVAERLLQVAARDYPRAWLAIGDDAATSDPVASTAAEGTLPPVERIGSDAAMEPAERHKLLDQARRAVSAREYAAAIKLLTLLQRQPEFSERAQAQELLGLARERSGQLAHAKAEYEEYLLRYPQGAAAERIRTRLRILRAASADGKSVEEALRAAHAWKLAGGVSQMYRRDSSESDAVADSTGSVTTQDAVFTDGDLLARRRGERIDMAARVSAGYAKDMLEDGPGDRVRISTAYFELSDRLLGLSGSLGRQSRSASGALGTFDGLSLGWQFRPDWSVQATAGLPVESSREAPKTDRRFTALSLGYAPDGSPWNVSAFLARQQFDGLRDRQAVGLEMAWFAPERSLVALVDYDTSYQSLNAAALIATLLLPARWTLNFDVERRNAPVLTTRNALIGQPFASLAELRQAFSETEIYDLARDRTPVISSYSVSASRPLGQRFHVAADVFGIRTGATEASGSVAATPKSPVDFSYQLQFFGNSVLRSGDFNVLAFRYDNSESVRITSIALMSRIPVAGAWRASPRMRLEQRRLTSSNTTRQVYVPALRIDYQRSRTVLELDVGAELGSSDSIDEAADTRRYFFALGYRIGF